MSVSSPALIPSFPKDVRRWFAARAEAVDRRQAPAHDGLVYLAAGDLLAKGVASELGGSGGDLTDMIEIIATVASACMTSAFVLWSHRSLIGLIAAADNAYLHRHVLPELLNVNKYGATGLADAVKYTAGVGHLRMRAETVKSAQVAPQGQTSQTDWGLAGYIVSGFVPWATNLVEERFVIAIAAQTAGEEFLVGILPGDGPGVTCQPAPPLLALDGSASGSLQFDDVPMKSKWVLSRNGAAFLAGVRPGFLLLQCGLPWGIAAAALDHAATTLSGESKQGTGGTGPRASTRNHPDRALLMPRVANLRQRFDGLITKIRSLGRHHAFDNRDLYRVVKARKELTELAIAAVGLELEAVGGGGYVAAGATARRLREAAFLPLQTPTLAQLQLQMDILTQ